MNRGTGLPENQVQALGVMNGGAVHIRRRRKDELTATGTRHRASHALAVKLHWALRIGVALEFLGHGLAGFYRPPGWIPYFTFFGIPETLAHDYMTYMTGTVDIALAILILFRPMRAVMLHMAVWGLLTALLRPLTGESWFELVERGANYGMPLALLVLSGSGGRSLGQWFERVRPPEQIGRELARTLAWITRGSIALLLVGHGGLGIWAAKQEWFDFLGWFGVADSSQAANLMIWVGVFEVVLGLAVLYRPIRSLLVLVLVWKLAPSSFDRWSANRTTSSSSAPETMCCRWPWSGLRVQCSQHFAPTSGHPHPGRVRRTARCCESPPEARRCRFGRGARARQRSCRLPSRHRHPSHV